MNNIFSYFREVRAELTKITWPKKDEVIKLTSIVLVFSAIIGAYLGSLDYIFTKLLEVLVSR